MSAYPVSVAGASALPLSVVDSLAVPDMPALSIELGQVVSIHHHLLVWSLLLKNGVVIKICTFCVVLLKLAFYFYNFFLLTSCMFGACSSQFASDLKTKQIVVGNVSDS